MGAELLNDDDITELDAGTRNMDEKQCCSVMFKMWLERQPKATWRQLIDALYAVKLNRIADELENLLMQSKPRKRKQTLATNNTNEQSQKILKIQSEKQESGESIILLMSFDKVFL